METREVKVAIVGAGTAGMRAYREVSAQTDALVLIEGGTYGTTCARVGCMPSKLLIAAAEVKHQSEQARRFGIELPGQAIVHGEEVMGRVRSERDRFVSFVLDYVERLPAAHKLRGMARFLDPHTLQVGDCYRVEAERIILATGSTAHIPPGFAELGERLMTNESLFYEKSLPESVAVFGAGVVGLELGQALHRLGVRTTLFGRSDRVGPLTDPAVLKVARQTFSEELPFYPSGTLEGLTRNDQGVAISFRTRDGELIRTRCDYVFAATGRKPALDRLALEQAGLSLDAQGVPYFDAQTGQCRNAATADQPETGSHIFIAGDVEGTLGLLHEAADEGRIAGRNAFNYPDDMCSFPRRSPLSVIFSDPQIAMVGESHAALVARRADFAWGEADYSDQGRSRVMLQNKGLLRVYGEEGSGRLLGAEMVGPRMEHLAHLLAWAHQSKLQVNTMLDMPFYHPVIEEGLRTALRQLRHNLKLGPVPEPRCLDCGPGA